jgi:glycosyltransferase involved in cell wall biosynthesis
MPDLSIIIPTRNEDMLGFTLKRLAETRGKAELETIVIDDGSGQAIPMVQGIGLRIIRLAQSIGLDYCRDTGIMEAKADTCLILDAHMNFHDGVWAAAVVDYAKSNPNHIACTVSVQLTPEDMEMRANRGRYYGADLISYEWDGNRHTIFPPKWRKDTEPGEIQCVLGANYLLSRKRYVETLNRPWHLLFGWGTSEAAISIINWLMGGTNVLLPVEIGHMYRTGQSNRVPYRTQLADIYHNQLWLLHALPLPDKTRVELLGHIQRNPMSQQVEDRINQLLSRSGPARYRQAAPWVRSWQEWEERWGWKCR